MTSTPTISKARAVRSQRTSAGSWCVCRTGASDLVLSLDINSLAPPFQQVDQDQHAERSREQHDRNGGRFRVGEFLEPGDNEHRRNLSLKLLVPRNENDGAVFSERSRERQGKPGHERR